MYEKENVELKRSVLQISEVRYFNVNTNYVLTQYINVLTL